MAGDTAPPPANAPDPIVGRELAHRYFIDRKLGEGGMGAVYVGRHMTLDKPVAIKVLHPEYGRKQDLVERFLQEAKAASKIRHENVIDITDFGVTEDGLVFFCMELLSGRDLHDLVTRARLNNDLVPWSRTGPIFLQICSALAAAHAQGIIHRDLKPENVFLIDWLGNPDFVKLLDFGIAKMTEETGDGEDGRKLTKTGMLFGTPEYMSPEQARGEKPDHRVDIYAMGCILYQLINGDVPFSGDTFMAVLSQHLTAEPPAVPFEALAAVGAPAALAAVVSRALAKDRDARYQSVEELAEAVRVASVDAAGSRSGWRDSAVLDAARASPTVTPVATQSRRGWLIGAGVVGIAAIAAAVVIATSSSSSSSAGSGDGSGSASGIDQPDEVSTGAPGSGTTSVPVAAADAGAPEVAVEVDAAPAKPTAAIEVKPREIKPREIKPREIKPREIEPRETEIKPGEVRTKAFPTDKE